MIGNLLGVLLPFREEPVAFSGDILKMFLQIMLPDSDTQAIVFSGGTWMCHGSRPFIPS